MAKKKRASIRRPQPASGKLQPPDPAPTPGSRRPEFCLRHVVKAFAPSKLEGRLAKGAFVRMEALAAKSWDESLARGREHGGTEWIPVNQLKKQIPAGFKHHGRVMVIRFAGKKGRMIGVRSDRVFHVLWFDASPFKVYGH